MEEFSSSNVRYIGSSERTETSPLQGGTSENRGLHIVVLFLSGLTVVVSFALSVQIYYGSEQIKPQGGIVTDQNECTIIGSSVLELGGNAIDAAVASTMCMGVVRPDLTGLGGGGLLIAYNQRTRKIIECYDFTPTRTKHRSIGFPGFVEGLKLAQKQHGILSWQEIMQPSIDLARNGFKVSEKLVDSLNLINSSELNIQFKEWLNTMKFGFTVKSEKLADTLEMVAEDKLSDFYSKSLLPNIKTYLNDQSDVKYSVETGNCASLSTNGYSVYTLGEGTGGPLLIHSLAYLQRYQSNKFPLLTIISSIQDKDELNFQQHFGTHVAATDKDDVYVSIVSGLGSILGSQKFSDDGYFFNNAIELDVKKTTRRPISLAAPVISVEENNVCGNRFIIGGGDVRDLIQLIFQLLYSSADIQSCVEAPRARLFTNYIETEDNHAPGFLPSEIFFLSQNGIIKTKAPKPYPSLNIITKTADLITAYADSRGHGEAFSF